MTGIIEIEALSKTYATGLTALDNVNLSISSGEVLALLGPNGAGKTTLISVICGLARASSGQVRVDGHDTLSSYRHTCRQIGLVPQDISLEPFETIMNTLRFSRGLFGFPANDAFLHDILKRLSLYEKRDQQIYALSGGMKRRVLVAKALSHEPKILFLDEPTAGVDVALRKGMWDIVNELRASGVTIVLTTHYLEEAEALADRIAIINKGALLLVEEKALLMRRLGGKTIAITLRHALNALPSGCAHFPVVLSQAKDQLIWRSEEREKQTALAEFLKYLAQEGIEIADIDTKRSSLEDIFVELVAEVDQ